jgi:hypothetical protein
MDKNGAVLDNFGACLAHFGASLAHVGAPSEAFGTVKTHKNRIFRPKTNKSKNKPPKIREFDSTTLKQNSAYLLGTRPSRSHKTASPQTIPHF